MYQSLLVAALASGVLSTPALSRDVIVFENKMVGDKKTWIPQDKNLTFGRGEIVKISLKNQLDGAHGFFIKGMTDPILVPGKIAGGIVPQLDFAVKVSELPGTYEFKCHMHPAHVGGRFVVK